MTWCNSSSVGEGGGIELITKKSKGDVNLADAKNSDSIRSTTCPSCGHNMEFQDQSGIVMHDLPGLPAGVKFDPSDQEILEHLEAKAVSDSSKKLHPLIDEFIPTLEGENGICYTHPEKLPGVSNDGQVRHFFHRPSKAYTTGTRKRRKVHTDHDDGSETRWHKTGKTRPVLAGGTVKGFKKILVLYTNYGRQRKPEKTNWVMHQYHLGDNEEEKDGELVASKVFYQTQPRQCGSTSSIVIKDHDLVHHHHTSKSRTGVHDHLHINPIAKNTGYVDYYNPSFVGSYDHNRESPSQLIPNLVVQGDGSSSFIRLAADASNKAKITRR